jgi:hypothetical protein
MDKKSIIIYVLEIGKYELNVKNCKFENKRTKMADKNFVTRRKSYIIYRNTFIRE